MRVLLAKKNWSVRELSRQLSEAGIETTDASVLSKKIRDGSFGHAWFLMVAEFIEGRSNQAKANVH
jgi:hypothetical protein